MKHKKIIVLVLCVATILFTVSCGKDLSTLEDKSSSSENEYTWSIYLYLIGSDLEDRGLNELSKLTETLTHDEAEYEDKAYTARFEEYIREFVKEVEDQGVSLPDILYNKTRDNSETSNEKDPDAIGFASYSLDTIIDTPIPEGVRFVIQTGGAKRWQSSLVNPNRSQRFVIDSNGIREISNSEVVNMADVKTLSDFMTFCKEEYPAKNELMLFWDHGGAYSGFGIDDVYGTDMFTIREIREAFQEVQKLFPEDDPIFDAIGFDACLMSNLETAHLFSDFADYYYASAEEMSAWGWGYPYIINALSENVDMDPIELGQIISDANIDNVQTEDGYGFYPMTFSVLDLNKVDELYDAYGILMSNILASSINDTAYLKYASKAALDSLAYGSSNYGAFNLIDLGDFLNNVYEVFPDEAEYVYELLNECVLYTSETSYYEGTSGVSIFFPTRTCGTVSVRRLMAYINEFSDNPDLDSLFYYKMAGCLNNELRNYVENIYGISVSNIDYSVLDSISSSSLTVSSDGNLTMELTEEQLSLIQSVSMGLIYVDESTSDLCYFQERPLASISEDGVVSTSFDLTWPSIDNSELPVQVIKEDDSFAICRIPVYYYGDSCYLEFIKDKETNSYEITGLTLNLDNGTGLGDRTVLPLEEGDEFYISYQYGNIFSKVEDEAYISSVYNKDTKIYDKKISDGTYLEYLRFDDIRTDTYYSPIVVITVLDGVVVDCYVDSSLNGIDYSKKQ